jgi:hypothetical protein
MAFSQSSRQLLHATTAVVGGTVAAVPKQRIYPVAELRTEIFSAIQRSPKGSLTASPMVYEVVRARKHGCTADSYNGNTWNHEMVAVAYREAQRLLPESHVRSIRKIEYSGSGHRQNELSRTAHFYVSVDDGELIIDPLYRNLLMLHAGNSSKFTSPYAEHLYGTLDPVFVGTVLEMEKLVEECYLVRREDPEHATDSLGDTMRWYREPWGDYSFYSTFDCGKTEGAATPSHGASPPTSRQSDTLRHK